MRVPYVLVRKRALSLCFLFRSIACFFQAGRAFSLSFFLFLWLAMDSDDHLRHHHLTLSLPVVHSSTATATPSPSPSTLHPPPPPAEVIVALAAATVPQEAAAAAGGGGHGREDCWSEGATFTLINAWGAHYLHLNRGNLKQKDWREVSALVNARGNGVAAKVPKTDVQCKNRLDTLKKKYKLEKRKMEGDLCTSKWPFYAKLDELIGPSKKSKKQQQPHIILPSDQQAMDAADRPPYSDPIPFVSRNPNGNRNPYDSRNPKEYTNPNECTNPKEGRNLKEWTNSKECTNLRDSRNPKESRNPKGGSYPKESPATTDSCQNSFEDAIDSKSGKKHRSEEEGDSPLKHLAQAIIKFGEVYERIESAKQQQLMEIEKQRMEFLKDLELQKMQLFMQTQVELAKMKHSKHGGTEHYL